jgi:hypothetical protein
MSSMPRAGQQQPSADAVVPGAARPRLVVRVLALRPDGALERGMFYARISIFGNIGMATWKLALLLFTPSLLLFGTGGFNLGVAAGKVVAVRTHRRLAIVLPPGIAVAAPVDDRSTQLRSYRVVGGIIAVLAAFYVICALVPAEVGLESHPWNRLLALGIATLTFVEIVIAARGAIVARRSKALLLEAVRLTNLAGALILVPLTQAALLSIAHHGDVTRENALSSICFGGVATLIGLLMQLRGRSLPFRKQHP